MHTRIGPVLAVLAIAAGCSKAPPPAAPDGAATPLSAWGQSIACADPVNRLKANKVVTLPIMLRNTSNVTWPAKGPHSVRLSYLWIKPDGTVLRSGIRTMLMQDVPPGASLTVPAEVEALPQPGPVTLRWSMVQEGVSWFVEHGSPGLDLPMTIDP